VTEVTTLTGAMVAMLVVGQGRIMLLRIVSFG